jgi:hypothetical protein
VELHGEGMFCQRDAGLLLVSPQGGLEKHTKTSGSRVVTHIRSKEEMWGLEGEFVRCDDRERVGYGAQRVRVGTELRRRLGSDSHADAG